MTLKIKPNIYEIQIGPKSFEGDNPSTLKKLLSKKAKYKPPKMPRKPPNRH